MSSLENENKVSEKNEELNEEKIVNLESNEKKEEQIIVNEKDVNNNNETKIDNNNKETENEEKSPENITEQENNLNNKENEEKSNEKSEEKPNEKPDEKSANNKSISSAPQKEIPIRTIQIFMDEITPENDSLSKETIPKENPEPQQTIPEENPEPQLTIIKENPEPQQTIPKENPEPQQTIPKPNPQPKQIVPKQNPQPKQITKKPIKKESSSSSSSSSSSESESDSDSNNDQKSKKQSLKPNITKQPEKPIIKTNFLDNIFNPKPQSDKEEVSSESESSESSENNKKKEPAEDENLTIEERYHKKVNFAKFSNLLGYVEKPKPKTQEQKIIEKANSQIEKNKESEKKKKFEPGMFDNRAEFQPKNRTYKYIKTEEEPEMRKINKVEEKRAKIIKNLKFNEILNEYEIPNEENDIYESFNIPKKNKNNSINQRNSLRNKKMVKFEDEYNNSMSNSTSALKRRQQKNNLDKKLFKCINVKHEDSDEENNNTWNQNDDSLYSLRKAKPRKNNIRYNTEPSNLSSSKKYQKEQKPKYLDLTRSITNNKLLLAHKLDKNDSIGLAIINKKVSQQENNVEKIKREIRKKLAKVSDSKDDDEAELLYYTGPIDIRNISLVNYGKSAYNLERRAKRGGFNIVKVEKNVYKCSKRNKSFLVQIVKIYSGFIYYLVNKCKNNDRFSHK